MFAFTASSAASKPLSRFAQLFAATLVAGFSLFSSSAIAQQANIEKEFPLPPTIADMKKGKTVDYETKKPGLGYSYRYAKAGWKADVYIYDAGVKNIPDGPKDSIVTSHMERAKQDVFTMQKSGAYSGVQLQSTFDVSNAAGKPVFTCAAFSFTTKEVGVVDSYLCLTGAAKKFVKVRLTTRQDANSKAAAEQFVTELAGVLPLR